MGKPSTTATDVGSLKRVRPEIRRAVVEGHWKQPLAKEIRELRKRSGLTIQQVARRARVPASTIQRLEDANPRWVSLPQLMRIVRAIGGMLTASRVARRWIALVHNGQIVEESFALDEAEALVKIREICRKLTAGAKVEKSKSKNQLEK